MRFVIARMVKVAIVGATGAVGREMIACLHSEKFTLDTTNGLKLFASAKSAGVEMDTPFGILKVEEFSVEAVKAAGSKIVFLAVSGDFSLEFSKKLVEINCLVIDNSSAFRYDVNVPLIVPELNGETLSSNANSSGLIANPNCTTAILAMALFPLDRKFKVKKLVCSTYQAASGAGEPGMQELESAIRAHANGEKFNQQVFSHNLCGNVIPCIDTVQDNGYTKEEMKMVWETQKIFGNKSISISCTAVRVPTLRAHCIAASIEFASEVSVEEVRSILSSAPGVVVVDDPRNKVYPVPSSATGKNDVEVGRIRQSLIFGNHGIDLFVCGDQLLRGAALNAVRIALHCVQRSI